MTSFESDSFEHYHLPTKETKRGVKFLAQESGAKATEEAKKELIPVKFILNCNWETTLRSSMDSVISREWTFGHGIAPDDLRSYNVVRDTVVN